MVQLVDLVGDRHRLHLPAEGGDALAGDEEPIVAVSPGGEGPGICPPRAAGVPPPARARSRAYGVTSIGRSPLDPAVPARLPRADKPRVSADGEPLAPPPRQHTARRRQPQKAIGVLAIKIRYHISILRHRPGNGAGQRPESLRLRPRPPLPNRRPLAVSPGSRRGRAPDVRTIARPCRAVKRCGVSFTLARADPANRPHAAGAAAVVSSRSASRETATGRPGGWRAWHDLRRRSTSISRWAEAHLRRRARLAGLVPARVRRGVGAASPGRLRAALRPRLPADNVEVHAPDDALGLQCGRAAQGQRRHRLRRGECRAVARRGPLR